MTIHAIDLLIVDKVSKPVPGSIKDISINDKGDPITLLIVDMPWTHSHPL
jgi:hypothetical protein